MANNPRRRRTRREPDISGQYRVTVPDVEELDQLRTRGGPIGEDCTQYLTRVVEYPLALDLYPALLENHPQNLWIRMRRDRYQRRFIVESSARNVRGEGQKGINQGLQSP